MECSDVRGLAHRTAIGIAVVAVATGVIAMFVCGILGRVGKLPMAPVGARLMITLPLIFVMGIISATYKR